MNSQQIANEAYRAQQAADAVCMGFSIGQQVSGPLGLTGVVASVDLKGGWVVIKNARCQTRRAKINFVKAL